VSGHLLRGASLHDEQAVTSPFGTPADTASGIMRRMTDPEIEPETPERFSPARSAMLALAGVGAVVILFFGMRRVLGPGVEPERKRCQTHSDCAEGCPNTPSCQKFTGERDGVCWCVGRGESLERRPGRSASPGMPLPPPTWWTCTQWVRPPGPSVPDAGPLDGACTRGPVLIVVTPPNSGAAYAAVLATIKLGHAPSGYQIITTGCHEGRDDGLDSEADGGLTCK